jgi:hypothetical protein
MGEASAWLFEPEFNRAIKVCEQDQRITSDAGVLLLREADHRLGLVGSLAEAMVDPRDPDNVRYTLVELLRERLYVLGQGYAAQDDVDRLAHDPALRMAVWDRPGARVLDERLASQPTQSRLLDALAAMTTNREALRAALSDWVERHVRARRGSDHTPRRGTIDVDSFPIEVHGDQRGAAYNGYYRMKIYHPLVASFSVGGDYDSSRLGNGFAHAMLRKGNAAAAEGVKRFLRTVLAQCQGLAQVLDVRLDAGLTHGCVMDQLTLDGVRFLGRLKSNAVLDRLAEPYLTRPAGRPPKEGYEFAIELGYYQAESWKLPQRLILVVVDCPDPRTGQLALFPRYFFIVTNWKPSELSAWDAVTHYRRRGTFEDRLGEFNQAIKPRFSSPEFRENEAALLLSLLAFNLTSMLRSEVEQVAGNGWDLSRFQCTLLKAGGRVVKRSRRLIFHLAQAVAPLWKPLVRRLRRWRLSPRWFAPPAPAHRTWRPPPAHAHLTEVLQL